jgi:HTH-type transcriptional regulator, transcriptional repressor of NAD biosynthesis genes
MLDESAWESGAMSNARFRLGLVVGKFAPLHLGHEMVIARAAECCERVLVLSYSKPSPEGCGVPQRRAWLEMRFPARDKFDVRVLDDEQVAASCLARHVVPREMPRDDEPEGAVHQAYLVWLLHEVLGCHPDAMFGSEDYVHACAALMGRAAGGSVEPVVVDLERVRVPVRATEVRRDPIRYRRFLAPEVASTFVRRVGLIGGESTGKTSLARALAERLGTTWVAEYGRERWELQGGRLSELDLLAIAEEQIRREDAALGRAHGWLVCDTTPWTTLGYAHWMFGRADQRLETLARRRYDRLVLCAPDFEFVQDGTRRDSRFRQRQHAWYLDGIRSSGSPWFFAEGPIDSRVDAIVRWLGVATEG